MLLRLLNSRIFWVIPTLGAGAKAFLETTRIAPEIDNIFGSSDKVEFWGYAILFLFCVVFLTAGSTKVKK